MLSRATARLPKARGRRLKAGAIVATALFAAVTAGNVAGGTTTITSPVPEQPGNVVRDSSITLSVNPGALTYARAVSGNYSIAGALTVALAGCIGDNPAGTNRTARSSVVVEGPSGVVHTAGSPARDPLTGNILNPQPTAPSNSVWRGGAWSTVASLAGQPAGTYTVTTTIQNRVRSLFPNVNCAIGVGNPTGSGFVAGEVVESFTFEYRPWQHEFADFFGGGSVRFNITPEEFTYSVGGSAGPLVKGGAGSDAMSFYALPDAAAFALPADPADCGTDPASCVPDLAIPCEPSAGCEPRLVVIDYDKDPTRLIGVFDLETRAFIALAQAGGKTRILASGGTVIDELLRTTFAEVVEAAAGAGIDLLELLDQPVVLRLDDGAGTTREITVSLLEGLQLTTRPTRPGPAGPTTLAAGLIVHIGTWEGDERPEGGSGYGYTVQEAGILPAIPSGLPAPANLLLSGGKLRHVVGHVPEGGGQHVIALSADTAPGEPNGLPVWLPIVSGAATVTDNGVEFLGDDAIVLSFELCLLGECAGAGLLLGTGLALFPISPLDGTISIGELPLLWSQCSAGLAVTCPAGPIALVTEIDGIIADVTGQVLTNPAVTDALAQLDPIIGPLLDDALGGVDLPGS